MILEEIVLENIGVFKGEHIISLATSDKEKPITLIGALNGSGKTTILQSLQLVLFGQKAEHLIPSSMSYSKFIQKRIMNEDTQAESLSRIKLKYSVNEMGSSNVYDLDRSWSIKNGKPIEKFEVYFNGLHSPHLGDSWNAEIQRLLPPTIAKLFFYDGEQIEMLADPAQSASSLKEGIFNLLGIDLIENLETDLKRVMSERRKSISKEVKNEIEIIEGNIDQAHKDLKLIQEKRANAIDELDILKKEKSKADKEFESIDGDLWLKLSEVKLDLDSLRQEKSVIRHQIHEWIAGPSPLIILIEMLDQISELGEAEKQAMISKDLNKVLKKRDRKILKTILKEAPKLSKKALTNIEDSMKKDYQSESKAQKFLGLSESAQIRLQTFLSSESSTLKNNGKQLYKEYESISDKIDTLESKIQNLDPDSKSHNQYVIQNSKYEHQIEALEKLFEDFEKDSLRINQQISNYEKDLQKYGESILADEDVTRFIDYSGRIVQSLQTFRDIKLKQHIELLETTITEAFKTLVRKRSLLDRITIDPNTFSLEIHDSSGRIKPASSLSAAERQLLSVAMLWGLARASGRVLPIVIDTPLGRLDGDHRPNIIEEYFPEASHQVVLLSTDTEIDQKLYNRIKGKLSNEYLLEFSDKTKSSSVNQGYFWG